MANYRIKIVKAGFEFEAEGDKKFVTDMLNRFEKGGVTTQGGTHSEKQLTEKTIDENKIKALSPGEFIRKTGFKKEIDIVLAFGYYLEKHSGLQAFAPSDINTCYYEAKMEASNTSQFVIMLIRKGYLMAAKNDNGKKKKYTLTSSGTDHIESRLGQNSSDK